MNQFITAGLGWFVTVICLIRIRYQHFLAMSRLYTKKTNKQQQLTQEQRGRVKMQFCQGISRHASSLIWRTSWTPGKQQSGCSK